MPPKKKGGKKAQDDWDEGLGEVADPIAAATQKAKEEEAANDKAAEEADPDEEFGGGGLMAALKRNRGKKQKKGKKVEDFDEGLGEDAPGAEDANGPAGGAEAVDLAAKAPEEADADDLFGPAKGKGGKGKAGGKQQPKGKGGAKAADEDDDDEDEEEEGGGIKSKKQKEKEKKEREKARKKEQAAKKKTAAPPPEPKKEPEKKVEKVEPEPAAASTNEKSGKPKKLLAALQKQQEELKRRQEQEQRVKQEELDRIKELERQAEEEERKKVEAKAAKKQREKEKIEQQKREGTYLTKAQKEQQAAAKRRMEQMIASGVQVAGLQEGGEEKKEKPAKTSDNKKKKGGLNKREQEEKRLLEEAEAAKEAQRKLQELKIAEEQASKAAAEAEKARQDAEAKKDESEGEDWEALAEKDDEDLKDSWDAPSDTDEKGAQKSVVNGKSVQPGATGKGAKVIEANESDEDSDEDDDSEEDSSDEELTAAQKEEQKRKREAAERREQRHQEALAARSKDNLRSPICCILGHVDTGKTKLLDKVRQTNVQEGEAGGITQQIGATYFPVDALKKKTDVVNKDKSFEFKVPGLLIIDTPGHESFTNLRSRGSSLCNIAILVVDIMHGLEPQTLESMRLLRDRKTPFIVALNKIDRLYGWSRIDNNGFQDSLSMQKKSVQAEFEKRVADTKLAFAEQGFNSELWYENRSMARNVSLVPTSAHTGEGVPDLLKLLVSLSQERMASSLMYLSEVEATILEVKVVEGLGTTIDVVLSNGILREGDRIVLCGLNGPIATNIRALLTPAEMKELRIKSAYVHNKEVKAAIGVKIAANDLESAIAGSRLMVVGEDDDEEDIEEAVMSDLENLLGRISKTGRGVSVQASTLGSLEALLEFLRVSKIPVANISIGPVYKRDVMQCGVMLEKAPEYAVMLCFDVKVDKEAKAYAEDVGIKVFEADIIYHLFDDFTKHTKEIAEKKKEESKMDAVFPCVLKPLAVFNKTQPIVLGVDVAEGTLRPMTPICAVIMKDGKKEVLQLGRVTSIEREHKQIPLCNAGQPSVAVKIEATGGSQLMYGRHLEESETLYSQLSRKSIDTLKEFFRDEVKKDEWLLVKKLKGVFDIA